VILDSRFWKNVSTRLKVADLNLDGHALDLDNIVFYDK